MEKYVEVIYNDTYTRLQIQKFSSEKSKKSRLNDILCKLGVENDNEEEAERTSISRTKRNIKEICLANRFEHFVTLTINKQSCNRLVLTECQNLLKKKLKALKRNNVDFGYIFITEKHDKGGFHFHGLIKGIDISDFTRFTLADADLSNGRKLPYKLINALQRGELIYHFNLFDSIGYNTISPIKDYNKCCNYILKYITKDCVRNEHNQIYISSRGLKKAQRQEVMPFDINHYNVFIEKNGELKSKIYNDDRGFITSIDFDWNELNEKQKSCYPFEIIPKKEFNKKLIDY